MRLSSSRHNKVGDTLFFCRLYYSEFSRYFQVLFPAVSPALLCLHHIILPPHGEVCAMHLTNGYGELNFSPRWYALQTKSRHEKKVDLQLKEKGITSYLPLNTVYHRWSDRYQALQAPLFSCYVFVYIALRDRLPVLQTAGAANLVSFNGVPAWIPDEQINAIKQVLESQASTEIADFLTPGKKVRIVRGPLKGLEGTFIIQKNNYRVVIAIKAIQQALAVEIDPRDLE